MPYLNDPSRIILSPTFSSSPLLNLNQAKNELGGGFVFPNTAAERVITYEFKSDTSFNFSYHRDIVDQILQDKEQWKSLKVKFVPFWSSSSNNSSDGTNRREREREREPDVHIRLSSEKTIKKECGFEGLSCAVLGGHNIYLNETNWTNGSKKSGLSLQDYRKYVLTHEMCHILGYLHETCSGPNEKVSIMVQQTLGTGGCDPYSGNMHFNSSNPPKIATKWD
jgi:ssRNA-specific RNase YbeY (16S rRNA maturation enzyme)